MKSQVTWHGSGNKRIEPVSRSPVPNESCDCPSSKPLSPVRTIIGDLINFRLLLIVRRNDAAEADNFVRKRLPLNGNHTVATLRVIFIRDLHPAETFLRIFLAKTYCRRNFSLPLFLEAHQSAWLPLFYFGLDVGTSRAMLPSLYCR